MCTISWLQSPATDDGAGSLEVFFNRDESRNRQQAVPPEILEQSGVQFLAPIDPDAGGTWLAANEHGVVVAVLNYYQAQQPASDGVFTSRGKLVTSLMDTHSVADAGQRMEAMDLRVFRAFILVLFSRDEVPRCLLWEGTTLINTEMSPPMRPITTSSFNTNEVVARRNAAFASLVDKESPSPEQLQLFHAHREEDDAYSVCMSRPDAHTVSFSRVQVGSEAVRFVYFPEGPVQEEHPAEQSLALKVASGR